MQESFVGILLIFFPRLYAWCSSEAGGGPALLLPD